jgi:hypothetical protein
MTSNQELAESMSPIEFDPESESFHATYDRTRDPTSLAVVAVVGAALEEDPQTLKPLQTVIDTDALDRLATESTPGFGNCGYISFRYNGFEITVTSDEAIEANPLEST